MKGVGGGGARFEKNGELLGADLNRADKRADTGGKRNMLDDIVEGRLHMATLKARTACLQRVAAMGRAKAGECEEGLWKTCWKKVLVK